MNKENLIIIISGIFFLIVAVGGLYVYSGKKSGNNILATTTASSTVAGKYDNFAKCLTSKGAIMYGAVWCENCKIQKDLFGSSFQYIKYVECPENAKLCLDKGIEGYPTWIFTNGREIKGRDTLEDIAKVSGCELPKE
jgi:hypothetical protein